MKACLFCGSGMREIHPTLFECTKEDHILTRSFNPVNGDPQQFLFTYGNGFMLCHSKVTISLSKGADIILKRINCDDYPTDKNQLMILYNKLVRLANLK